MGPPVARVVAPPFPAGKAREIPKAAEPIKAPDVTAAAPTKAPEPAKAAEPSKAPVPKADVSKVAPKPEPSFLEDMFGGTPSWVIGGGALAVLGGIAALIAARRRKTG